MVFDETLQRTAENGAHLEVDAISSFAELVLVVPGNTTDKGYGQVGTAIGIDVDGEEVRKVVVNQSLEFFLFIDMARDKVGQRGKESISQGLTVDTFNEDGKRKLCLLLEKVLKIFGKLSAVEVMNESLAEDRPTTLVAEDIAHGGRMLHNLSAVVEAGVGSCSEDAGYTLLTATEGSGCAKQVTMGLDGRCLWEHLIKNLRHKGLFFRTDTTAVEIDGIGEFGCQAARTLKFAHFLVLGHAGLKLVTEDTYNFLTRLMDGVDALSLDDNRFGTGCNDGPVGLGASAICNKYHINLTVLMFLTAKVVKKIIMSKNNRLFLQRNQKKAVPLHGKNKRGMKRLILILVAVMGLSFEADAVLKEKDLEQTLAILQVELEEYNNELKLRTNVRKARTKQLITQLLLTMKQADQNALMLYSQEQGNVFDLTYACHEATKQYNDFHRHQLPFTEFLERNQKDLARYDSLITRLESLPTTMTTKYGSERRDSCLVLAKSIHKMLSEGQNQLHRNIRYYNQTEQRLSNLNDYANKRYSDIQRNIFINGGENYLKLLGNIDRRWPSMTETVRKKYSLEETNHSQWSGRWILFTFSAILFYVIIAVVLNQLFFRFLMPKRFDTEEFRKKRACIIMATTTITFAIIQGAISIIGTGENYPFLYMASNLLVEYAWLLGVILISLLLRVEGEQIGSAIRIYAPLITVGFIVIGCRIILIPNELVNILLPPVLLICAIWQRIVIKRHNKNIPRSDIFYTYISLAVFIASVACSWAGYTLLAVQLLIWWIMQLTCILTITCISRYIELYAKRRHLEEAPITKSWSYLLVEKVVMPALSVNSVMLAIFWAAKVFNLSDLCWRIFKYHFIDLENLQVSILKLAMVITMWFVFRYIVHTILALLKQHYVATDPSTADSKEVMGKNVIQVFVWGVWLMIALSLFHISVTWLLAISGGLSTGIGFASKDIIENIYYGASLMAGRVKVGDWIEVDGRMGKVVSISYTSTVVESLYGEVITFQNAQLFKSNYKNLTKNHGYVLAVVPFGVAYGSNLKQVTELVETALNNMRHQWMDKRKPVKCVCSEMGDSSVNFNLFVWADAPKKSYVVSDVLKCVYDTLNANGISIPFPQRDIHLIKE